MLLWDLVLRHDQSILMNYKVHNSASQGFNLKHIPCGSKLPLKRVQLSLFLTKAAFGDPKSNYSTPHTYTNTVLTKIVLENQKKTL